MPGYTDEKPRNVVLLFASGVTNVSKWCDLGSQGTGPGFGSTPDRPYHIDRLSYHIGSSVVGVSSDIQIQLDVTGLGLPFTVATITIDPFGSAVSGVVRVLPATIVRPVTNLLSLRIQFAGFSGTLGRSWYHLSMVPGAL